MKTWMTLAILILSTGAAAAENLLVFAAASLSDALEQIRDRYEQVQDDRVEFNFDGSSKLARQIGAGAPADVFLSADEAKMDQLQEQDLLLPSTRSTILSNQLVLVTVAGDQLTQRPEDLLRSAITRIALAQPDSVPAGIYAKAYLASQNLWDGLAAKIIPTENVRAALAAVETGNADAAFVYKTDVRPHTKVRLAYAVPTSDTPPITYPIAILKSTQHPEAARRWLAFLQTPEATGIFTREGFLVLPPPPPP